MFEEPETKRIRRADLFSSSPSPPPPESTAPLHIDLEFVTAPPAKIPSGPSINENSDIELDFPLFSGTARQRVALRSPTPPPAEETIWDAYAHSQKRPLNHWILSESDITQCRVNFDTVAVSGLQVLEGAKHGWPAVAARCEWKVVHTPGDVVDAVERRSGRKKPGKKRRIQIRIARKREKEREEARLKSQMGRDKFKGLTAEEREKAEKEEKIRKNREKKLKKRLKEKEKKAAAVVSPRGDGEAVPVAETIKAG